MFWKITASTRLNQLLQTQNCILFCFFTEHSIYARLMIQKLGVHATTVTYHFYYLNIIVWKFSSQLLDHVHLFLCR